MGWALMVYGEHDAHCICIFGIRACSSETNMFGILKHQRLTTALILKHIHTQNVTPLDQSRDPPHSLFLSLVNSIKPTHKEHILTHESIKFAATQSQLHTLDNFVNIRPLLILLTTCNNFLLQRVSAFVCLLAIDTF